MTDDRFTLRLGQVRQLLDRGATEHALAELESMLAERHTLQDVGLRVELLITWAYVSRHEQGPSEAVALALSEAATLAEEAGLFEAYGRAKVLWATIERQLGSEARMMSHLADVLSHCSDQQDAAEIVETVYPPLEEFAQEAAGAPDLYDTWIRVVLELSESYTARGRPQDAMRVITAALAQSLEPLDRMRAAAAGGQAALFMGLGERAKTLLMESIAISESQAGETTSPATLQNLARAHKLLEEYPEAIALLSRADLRLRAASDRVSAVMRASNLIEIAAVHREMSNVAAARPYVGEARALLESIENKDPTVLVMQASALTNLGLLDSDEEKFDAAISHQRAALGLLTNRDFHYAVGLAQTHENLGLALFGAGDFDQAKTHMEEALEIHTQGGNIARRLAILLQLGHLELERGSAATAFQHFNEVERLAEFRTRKDALGRALFGKSMALWQQGDRGASAAEFDRAVRAFESIAMPHYLAFAYAQRADLISSPDTIEEEVALRSAAARAWADAGQEFASQAEQLKRLKLCVMYNRGDLLGDDRLDLLERLASVDDLRVETLYNQSLLLAQEGAPEPALDAITAAIATADGAFIEREAFLHIQQAAVLQAMNRTTEATTALRLGMSQIARVGREADRGSLWYFIATRLANRFTETVDELVSLHHALESSQRLDDKTQIYVCKKLLGELYARVQRGPDAIRYLSEALEYARTHGGIQETQRLEHNLGVALLNEGALADAFEQFERARRMAEEYGLIEDAMRAGLLGVETLRRSHQWPTAERLIGHLTPLAATSDNRSGSDKLRVAMALVRLDRAEEVTPTDWAGLLDTPILQGCAERVRELLAANDGEGDEKVTTLLEEALYDLAPRTDDRSLAEGAIFSGLRANLWQYDRARNVGWRQPSAAFMRRRAVESGLMARPDSGDPDRDAVRSLIARYHDLGVWEDPNAAILVPTIDRATAGGRFEGRALLNPMALADGCLHFFFFRSDPDGQLARFLNTCAYVSHGDVVLCSLPFLEQLASYILLHDVLAEVQDEASSDREGLADLMPMLVAGFGQFLVDWVIAHEVGHAELGHQSPFLTPGHQSREYEQAADDFYVARLGNEHHASETAISLANVLAKAYHECYVREFGKPYDGEGLVTEHATIHLEQGDEPHPPFVIRLLNLADRLLARYPDVDRTGYYVNVRKNIHLTIVGHE
jgi:tetratricopeptide (TPR) repeat protein